ncbi:MAG TPA: NAD(P)-binding domain-containing protein [Gemmatimonadales bacterium]|nr:NAD(P)-binding domain-containing protein [Gemmatimonadales bacterium]
MLPSPDEIPLMNVGILGSGPVAKTLAAGFLQHGHAVMVGTRDAGKLAEWQSQNARAKIGTFTGAAKFGEVVVLAAKGDAALDVLRLAGAAALGGKVVMDTTNPIAAAPPVNGVLKFFTTLDDSLMERLQRAYPDARFVKAFNSVGNVRMVNPQYAAGRPTMFICGNDAAAKQTVAGVVEQFGWETLDLGSVEAARAIEPLCILWCIPGFLRNEWTHAFKVLHS